MRQIVTASLLLSLISCGKSSESITVDFENCQNETLSTTICSFDESLYPIDLVQADDSILVVYEPKGENYYLKVFDINTGKMINSLCNKGNGPEDYLNLRFMPGLDIGGNCLAVGDFRRINAFATDSIATQGYTGHTILIIPEQLGLYNYILSINDNKIVFSQTGEHPVSIFYPETQEVIYIDHHPDYITEELSPLVMNMEIYDATYACHNNLVVKAYKNWNQIDLIDSETHEIKSLIFNDHTYNRDHYSIDTETGTVSKDPDAKIFFTKVKTSDKYVFALNWDAKPEDIKNGNATSTIYKLDYDGNAVARYTFDTPVSNFGIDKVNDRINYLIGIGNDGEIHILKPISDPD